MWWERVSVYCRFCDKLGYYSCLKNRISWLKFLNLKARIHYYFRLLEYCLAEILATFITVMLITSIANYYIFINHKMEVERKRDTQTLIEAVSRATQYGTYISKLSFLYDWIRNFFLYMVLKLYVSSRLATGAKAR